MKIITIDGHMRFDKRLRTMHELCGYGCVQGRTRLKRLHKVNQDQEVKSIDEVLARKRHIVLLYCYIPKSDVFGFRKVRPLCTTETLIIMHLGQWQIHDNIWPIMTS